MLHRQFSGPMESLRIQMSRYESTFTRSLTNETRVFICSILFRILMQSEWGHEKSTWTHGEDDCSLFLHHYFTRSFEGCYVYTEKNCFPASIRNTLKLKPLYEESSMWAPSPRHLADSVSGASLRQHMGAVVRLLFSTENTAPRLLSFTCTTRKESSNNKMAELRLEQGCSTCNLHSSCFLITTSPPPLGNCIHIVFHTSQRIARRGKGTSFYQ